MTPTDIILTWPKGRALASYLLELRKAEAEALNINYRIARPPRQPFVYYGDDRAARCYMVHDGMIRGYNEIIDVVERGGREVRGVAERADEWWPPGWYVVRDPKWYSIAPIEMAGFRGFRYWPQDQAIPVGRG